MVTCPTCKKRIPYDRSNPFRPFCSERCKLIDLGAWASEERTIAGRPVNEDEDADLLQDPNLPVRNVPGTDE
ncbi:MAG: DNA gyrase inhibitor YacG [Anaerobiospirillum sp.]|nr:DNA gyrase inhibitor YacG [Anaerobiospirillum sp.]